MIKLMKLVTGEEVVADVTEDGDYYKLKNPMQIGITPQGLGMAPLCPLVKSSTIRVKTSNILFEGELEDEIYNAYNSQFGSGLVVPNRNLKLFDQD